MRYHFYALCFTAFMLCLQASAQDSLRCGYSRNAFDASYIAWYKQATEYANDLPHAKRSSEPDTVYRVPVVFHFIYPNGKQPNLSLLTVKMDQLNADFRRQNKDTLDLREIFKDRVGDTRIELFLAKLTPDGQTSNGYTITKSNKTFGAERGEPYSKYHGMKFDSTGGIKAWDTRRYLNIWVCDLTTPSGFRYVAGFATPPKMAPTWAAVYYGDSLVDGVAIDHTVYNYVGRSSTFTHEIGHYLGLRHVSGDPHVITPGVCKFDDSIRDTPGISGQNYFTCDKSINSCDEGLEDMPDMLENYMDYTGDECRNAFTKGQGALMRYCLLTLRPGLSDMHIHKAWIPGASNILIYPNVIGNTLHIELTDTLHSGYTIELYDMLGQQIFQKTIVEMLTQIDVRSWSQSAYLIRIRNEKGELLKSQKLIREF